MKRHRLSLSTLLTIASAVLVLALGGALAAGHYLGAVWDAPLERLLAGVAATLDLRSPTIVLAVLVIGLGALLVILATRNLQALDFVALDDEDPSPPAVEAPAPAAMRTVLVNCDLENEFVHENEVPAFVRGFSSYYSGSKVEGYVYCESSLKPGSVKALVAQQFEEHNTPHNGQLQVADRAMIRGILMRLGRGLASDEQFRVILVTHDTDFIPMVRVLKFIGILVTVFVRSPTKVNESALAKFRSAGAEIDRFDRFL